MSPLNHLPFCRSLFWISALIAALLALAPCAQATVKIEGTRLIYFGQYAVVQPLVRLDAQQHHLLRILYAGAGLPSDVESMFLLNVMEIPLKPEAADSVQFAVRQRLKLFYRPAGLAGSSSEAVPQLVWSRTDGQTLTVTNPSAFHLSLVDVQVDKGGQVQVLDDYLLLKPGERKVFSTQAPISVGSQINFTEITDIGLQARHRAVLK